ncbi:MAG: hypothetical protein ABWZ74_05580 [Hyphomicrobiaceae bacterium]
MAPGSAAVAAVTVDCASINTGHLDVALASDSNTLRTVEMNEGDTLAFTFRADARATGTITLVKGDGSEQRLLYGPHATQVSYTADRPGAVAFRLATKGGKVATFVTICTPELAQSTNAERGSDTMALDGLNIDMSVPLSLGATTVKDGNAGAVATPRALDLQWIGQQSATNAPATKYGVNLKLQPAIMIGMLAQFDQTGDPLLGPSTLSDQAWLAGPVTNVQLGGGLTLDARVTWGPTDPGLSAIGHAGARQTLDARLASKQEAGPWRFTPSIGLSRVQEKLGSSPVEQSAELAGQQTVESGRVDVKPELAYRVDMSHSMFIEPKVMVGTFWNLGDASAPGIAQSAHEARHMAETGITVGTADGTKLQVGGSIEEGATRADNVWGGKMQLNIPLK